jgi:hypothetical protein
MMHHHLDKIMKNGELQLACSSFREWKKDRNTFDPTGVILTWWNILAAFPHDVASEVCSDGKRRIKNWHLKLNMWTTIPFWKNDIDVYMGTQSDPSRWVLQNNLDINALLVEDARNGYNEVIIDHIAIWWLFFSIWEIQEYYWAGRSNKKLRKREYENMKKEWEYFKKVGEERWLDMYLMSSWKFYKLTEEMLHWHLWLIKRYCEKIEEGSTEPTLLRDILHNKSIDHYAWFREQLSSLVSTSSQTR